MWVVEYDEEYLEELYRESDVVRVEVFAKVRLLERLGPLLQRPHCDTLEGSKYANMKELRFSIAGGV